MKTVLAHGCFDLLHAGHLAYFQAAKGLGDRLVVSVTADEYVNKGPGRPCFPLALRMQMLKELIIVDNVVTSCHPTAVEVIHQVRPAVYVKGPDYIGVDTPDLRAEIDAVRAVGGEFVCLDLPAHSSSSLANRFFVEWSDEQRSALESIKALGGMDAIRGALDKAQKEVQAVVVGECIQDVYRFVRPEGISSKSPTLSARFVREETYKGGSWAIYQHMKNFCDVRHAESLVHHKKIRYIAESGQRLFEVTHINKEPAQVEARVLPKHNLLLCADFGHGLIPKNFVTRQFKALNVQTNSSNYGFNTFKLKHSIFDFLVVDLRELQLAYQDRTTPARDLGAWTHAQYMKPIALTLGPEGAVLYKDGTAYECPAFCDRVVDATGAGDAFYMLTSLLMKVDAHPLLTVFLGNVFAGLKAKIIGNKDSVTKESLFRTCEALLK